MLYLEQTCADIETQKELKSTKREMKGIFEGNLEEGMIEAGQGSGLINDIPTVSELMNRLIEEYNTTIERMRSF
jgi:enoyl-[acyl-carrier protein] reductase II